MKPFPLTRCSLSGVDLNRQWKRPSKALHPTIFATKMLIRNERISQREVFMYVDLHGHSRKQNVFMYGCDDKRKPRPAVRVFPKLLSWNRCATIDDRRARQLS
jgi:cytosolic carboxypeptidase protein 2/3